MIQITDGNLRWMTAEGEVLLVHDMVDRHLVMTFKMLYNHLTPITGLPEVQFTRRHQGFFRLARQYPEGVLSYIWLLSAEIEERTLPRWLEAIYDEILGYLSRQITGGDEDNVLQVLAEAAEKSDEEWMLDMVRECNGAEIQRDDWPVAESLVAAGKIYLGRARGPGGDWRRAGLTAEEART